MRDALDAAETQKMEMEIRRNTLEKTLARIEELEKEGDALYEGLFVEGIPSELYDAYLTSLALDLGITPTSLVINPVSAKRRRPTCRRRRPRPRPPMQRWPCGRSRSAAPPPMISSRPWPPLTTRSRSFI